jgi:hypothetical protein
LHNLVNRPTPDDRFYGAAFMGYLGPLQPNFDARATILVPKTTLQRSSPSIQFHIVEVQSEIEGGLMRDRGYSALRAFATDVVGGRRVLRILAPVRDGPHAIAIRGTAGLLEFLVDGKLAYRYSAHFPMDLNSALTIGTLVSHPGDRVSGRISNLAVSANGRALGDPSCIFDQGGISLERQGSAWALRGRYDTGRAPVKIGCNVHGMEAARANNRYPIPFVVQPDWEGVTSALPNAPHPSAAVMRRHVLGHAVIVVRLVSGGTPPANAPPSQVVAARVAYANVFKNAKRLPRGDVYVVMTLYGHPTLLGIRPEYAYIFARTSGGWEPRPLPEKELTAIECDLGRCPNL